MDCVIKDFDFMNMDMQKYWSFPSSYNKAKRKEQFSLMLYSDDYMASEKKDGYAQIFMKDADGNYFMRARTKGVNGWVCKTDWFFHLKDFFEAIPPETVFICEAFLPNKTSKDITKILGCKLDKAIDRQIETGKLHLSIFDVLAYNGELLYNKPMEERVSYLPKIREIFHEYVEVVHYWTTPDDIYSNWLRILSEGGEGVVMTRKDNPYEFGKRTARHTLKLKKELEDTIDAFLTGRWKEPVKHYSGTELDTWKYWYDTLKEEKVFGDFSSRVNNSSLEPVTRLWYLGYAAAVEIAVILDGKVTPIGWISGIDDTAREGIVKFPTEYKGKVVELQAMEIAMNDGIPALRHGKIMQWRSDKTWEDCVWQR